MNSQSRWPPRELGPIAEYLPALISWVGADCRYRWVNHAYEEFFGHSRDEIQGRHMREVLGDDTWDVIRPYIERTLGGEPVEYQARLPYQYGGAREVLANYVPHRDGDGNVDSFFVLVHDISERKRLETQLRDAEHRISRVLESVPEGYFELDQEWRFLYMNAEAERYFGKPREDFLGRSIYEAFPTFAGSEFERIYIQALQKREPAAAELVGIAHLDRWVDVRAYPTDDGLAVFFRNITARKRAEAGLRDSEARFRELADAMPQVVWIANSAGKVEYHNKRVSSFSSTATADGAWDWAMVIHPEDLPATEDAWRSAVERGEAYELEHRILMADGSYRWHLSRAIPARDDGRGVILWYGTATDVHAARSALEKLRQADQRKDEFLAVLSHELRTPLTAAYGWAKLLRGTSALDPETRDAGLEAIENSLEAQTRLIDELLDLSRITTGKLVLEAHALDLGNVIDDAVVSVRLAAQARRLALQVELSAEPLPIVGDPSRLRQIVWNLLSNAIKFTPEGGRVSLRTSREGDHAVLEVVDTGVGITPEFLPVVFQRFTQWDSSSTRRWGGLGLGLAIVRHLVELHGGGVEASSEGAGRGATFKVRIPLASSNKEPETSTDPSTVQERHWQGSER